MPIVFSVLLIGVTAMVAQIVLVRELITVFYGNEVSIGFILASWLLLGSVGSLLLGRFADRIKTNLQLFACSQIFLSMVLPLALILIRFIKKALGVVPGEIIGFGAIAWSSFLILSPICVVLGFLFALSCKVYSLKKAASQIGKVYILEAIGAGLGGLITSFFLIKSFSSVEILSGLSILNIAASLSLSKSLFGRRGRALFRTLVTLWLIGMLGFLLSGGFQKLDGKLLQLEWSPLELVSSKNSIYGNVAVTRRGDQISFFSNGLHNFSVPDELTQEETVHFALLEHPNPEFVLLIGGGLGGLVREILKHPVGRIDYVELDPLILELGNRYLKDAGFVKKNPKVSVINTDGRLYVKNPPRTYDVIIVSLPNPFTAQINRFYTLEFFQEVNRLMRPGGVLSFGVTSSENYISNELGRFLGSINNTLKRAFSEVSVIPGDTAHFLASNQKGLINLDYKFLSSRLKERQIDAKFVRDYYLFSSLSPGRLDYINRALERKGFPQINRDFKPISYYYDMVLWSIHFNGLFKKLASKFNEFKIWLVFGLAYALLIIIYPLTKRRLKSASGWVMVALGTTGFSEIAFEIALVLAFQVIYGFMYYRLGLILTAFMVGLAFGSLHMTRNLDKIKHDLNTFLKIQLAIVVYPLLLPPIFLFLSMNGSTQFGWFGSNIIFPLLPAIAGFIGGLQFPLGTKIYLGRGEDLARTGGTAYGVDLIGSCIGAIAISSILIPILGIFKTCIAVSALNLSVLILLIQLTSNSKNDILASKMGGS